MPAPHHGLGRVVHRGREVTFRPGPRSVSCCGRPSWADRAEWSDDLLVNGRQLLAVSASTPSLYLDSHDLGSPDSAAVSRSRRQFIREARVDVWVRPSCLRTLGPRSATKPQGCDHHVWLRSRDDETFMPGGHENFHISWVSCSRKPRF